LLAAAGFVLAWMAQRNGILFTFLALPALFWNLQNHLSITRRKTGVVLTITIFVLLFISLGSVSINHLRMLYSWPHTHSPFSHPAESAKLLKNTPPTGNLFNADRFGGYLLWHVYPTYRVSHDTRLTMRSASFFREYLSLTSHPETFQEYARKWNITRVVLPLAPIDLYLPLAASLYRHPGWKCVYTDGAEILFAADSLGSTPGIDMNAPSAIKAIVSRLSQKFSSRPQLFNEALTWFGRWCAFAGAYRSAENVLSRCRSINGEIILAGVKEQQGYLHQAERRYRKLITDYPGNHTIQIEAALFFLRTGRENDGLHLLSAVLKKDPFNKRARDILLRITTSDKE
jgi:hypothetical protein